MTEKQTGICAQCSNYFESVLTEDEARMHSEEVFPDITEENRVLVCDPCYKDVTARLYSFRARHA